MPIQFPQPKMGNPFDNWLWQRGAKPPQQQNAPNLARVGAPFNRNTLDGGLPGRGVQLPKNLRRPSTFYVDPASTARVNPASQVAQMGSLGDGCVQRIFVRALGSLNMSLSGTSRDSSGAVLGFCTVLVFRTQDNRFIGSTTSDALGAWTFPLLQGGPFFLVEYKAGSPDLAGTSQNTLVPVPV